MMNTQTTSFYNRFSSFYPLVDFFLRPQKHVMFQEINRLHPGDLLEIGVGSGAHLHLYKTHQITGIDTSSNMLEMANKRNRNNAVLLQMDGQELCFPDASFDYVVLSHVLAVVDDPELVLEEVCRVLKPGGRVFILNHFTPDNWLKYLDKLFGIISKRFHFKSVFYIHDLRAVCKFSLLQEVSFGSLAYFKLLIYQKT